MASRDYILCKECRCKVIYDGNDSIRDSLEQKWGDPYHWTWTLEFIRCPDCQKKLEQALNSHKEK